MDNPFVSPMDLSMTKEQEENAILEADNAVVALELQDEKSVLDGNDISQSLDMISEGNHSLFSCEKVPIVKKEIPSAPLKHTRDYSLSDEKESESRSTYGTVVKDISNVEKATMEKLNQRLEDDTQIVPELAVDIVSEEENLESYSNKQQTSRPLANLHCSTPKGDLISKEAENQNLSKEENSGHAEDIRREVMTESMISSLPEDEILLEIKLEDVQEPVFAWQPLSDREPNSVVNMVTEEISKEANELSLSESHEHSEQKSFVSPAVAPEESVYSSPPFEEILSDTKEDKENQTPQSHAVPILLSETENSSLSSQSRSAKRSNSRYIGSRRGKSASILQIRTNQSKGKATRADNNSSVVMQKAEDFSHKSFSVPLQSDSEKREAEILTDKENLTPNSLMLKRLQEISENGENRSLCKVAQRPSPLKIPSFSRNIRLEENIIAASENLKPEIFTPDKENLTPNSHFLKRLQDIVKLEENKTSSSSASKPFSSKVASFSPDFQSGKDRTAAPEKENQTLREQKPAICTSRSQVKLEQEAVAFRMKTERVPFQPLLQKSPAKSGSFAGASITAAGSSSFAYCSQKMEKRISHSSSINSIAKSKMRWTIVVDTTSLLEKKSRKSIELLEGLKGTQLVVPRTVLRELDSLKRRGSLFRNTTEVTSVLEWIEECMVKTKWWIHVQSSVEEKWPIAPTPPASPQSQFIEGETSSSTFPFSIHRNSIDMVSPTSQDHILDCALMYRKKHYDGQLVLLSNDVTLKIKAMAEGIICETAVEFYESVVNPFSERFLWAESSPRGQTWSHLDDVVLRERYNNRSLFSRKSSKGESAKGLKLILLHNSHYGQTTPSSREEKSAF